MIYLDWAATTPPDPSILAQAAELAARHYGNPSSKHGLGNEAKKLLEESRSSMLRTLGGDALGGRLVFTSGGSEGDAIILLSTLRQALNSRRDGSIGKVHILTTEIEHAAVYEQAKLLEALGIQLSMIKPERDGRISPARLAESVRKETALVAVMAVNNETGAIQPIAELAKAVEAASAGFGRKCPRFHVDAVQALGKIDFKPQNLGIASASFSAHKIRGPRGIGALWLSQQQLLENLAIGGGQEQGLRAGTENLQGAWAFAEALRLNEASRESREARARSLEARLISGISAISGARVLPEGRVAGDDRYTPFILSAAFPGLSGEVMVRALSDRGIAVSTGSACSNNAKRGGKRVLEAMAVPAPLALSSIRVSTGESTSENDIDNFLEAAEACYRSLKT